MCHNGEFFTVPNKQVHREVMSLQIFCSNKEKGCIWQGDISNIQNHLESRDGCQFETVECFNSCKLKMQRQFLATHVGTKCPQHTIECQYCKSKGKRQFITGKHTYKCCKLPLPCPNARCKVAKIPHEDIDKHRKVCTYENVQCHNKCGRKMQRQYLANHVETECPRRKVACQYCHSLIEYRVLKNQHREQCHMFPLPCPNDCDIKDIPRQDVIEHRKICQLEIVQCTNECGKAMQRQYLTGHLENKCPCRKVYCQYCNVEGEHQFITDMHVTKCHKFPLTCPNECDIETVCRGNMDEHRKVCPLEKIDCEYYKVGCKTKIPRKDLEKHYKENMKEHLLLTTKKLNDTEDELRGRMLTLERAMQYIINSTTMQQNDKQVLWPSHLQLASSIVANAPGEHVTPVIIKMSNFAQNKLQEKKWFSPPFYSHTKGYKMCMSVYPYGNGKNESTHMSVFLHRMKGPYDDYLWPLEENFELKLLNQISDTEHDVAQLSFGGRKDICHRVTKGEIGSGWEFPSFISNENLNKVTSTCQFLKDDSVFFEIHKLSSEAFTARVKLVRLPPTYNYVPIVWQL